MLRIFPYYAYAGDLSLVIPISFLFGPETAKKEAADQGRGSYQARLCWARALSVDPAQEAAVPLLVIVASLSHWGKNKVSS